MAPKMFALFLAVNLVVLGVAAAAARTPVETMSAAVPGQCSLGTDGLVRCASTLHQVLKAKAATAPVQQCCSLVKGLVDAEAAACLCSAVKVAVRGDRASFALSFGFVLNNCGRKAPGFTC